MDLIAVSGSNGNDSEGRVRKKTSEADEAGKDK
jgi:hypothetical protein